MIEPVSALDTRCRQEPRRFFSQLVYLELARAGQPVPVNAADHHKNPLMRHWFDGNPKISMGKFVRCSIGWRPPGIERFR
jgi:hypothetical protein